MLYLLIVVNCRRQTHSWQILTFCWPCISVYLSQYLTNLMHKILFHNKFYFTPLHVLSTCAHHQEVKIALHSLWYHHTYRWLTRAQVERREMATYGCDDTRGCVMQFWPPDDEHMCSKHVEALNKTYCETNFCASSWLNTQININDTLDSGHPEFVGQCLNICGSSVWSLLDGALLAPGTLRLLLD